MRDSRSHFIAYVPPGSIEQGRQLATTGGSGKTAPCTGPQVMTERGQFSAFVEGRSSDSSAP